MARKPSKKRKKRTPIINAMDKMVSLQVRAAANHICELCGRRAIQVHHVITRNNMRVRWDRRNLVSICGGCHFWAEGHPVAFTRWWEKNRPEDCAYLEDEENTKIIHRTTCELEDLREEMKRAA